MRSLIYLAVLLIQVGLVTAQNQIGLTLKFDKQISTEHKMEFVQEIKELGLDGNYTLIQGFNVDVFLFSQEYTHAQNAEISKIFESSSLTEFVGPFNRSTDGTMAGKLPEIFVKFKPGTNRSDLLKECDKLGFEFRGFYQFDPSVCVFQAKSKVFTESSTKLLKDLDGIQYASQNVLFTPSVNSVNDSLFNLQWSLLNDGTQWFGTPDADMDVDSAWTKTTGVDHVRVAILDSGTDTAHIDLKGNLIKGFDATGGSSQGYPNTTLSSDAHGTATAGIVAATGNNTSGIAGVAYNSTIVPVRIFFYINFGGQEVPFATTQSGADGVNWATDSAQADILSNSWGLTDAAISQLNIDTAFSNDQIKMAIQRGRYGKGLVTLFSSGNDADTFSIWPASLPQTISVGATSMCDELKSSADCSSENWGSNHNLGLDVCAPGVRVVTTDISGAPGYSTSSGYTLSFNGTSAACPNAAGVAALILAVDSTFSGDLVREILSKSCEKVGGYSYNQNKDYGTWSKELGYGRVNAYQAVLRAEFTSNSIIENERSSMNLYVRLMGDGVDVVFSSNHTGFHEMEVFDISGKLLHRKAVNLVQGQESIERVLNLNRGAYIVKLRSENDIVSQKFVF
ncbi:MAG: S8 family peptidase [Flavobacteriales bacterium]|nr:S8 family peptidase [Flavobacteriales bacterium]